ncbi:C40 family peptidase [Pseudonocardia sp. MCCB 268]|nr:C40 family peptidase [Pseudonocardia cytotoxica]
MDLPPWPGWSRWPPRCRSRPSRTSDYGDRDSPGQFQQRPSMGWGDARAGHRPRVQQPDLYERLLEVPGWDSMPVTVAVQTGAAPAFPDAHAKWETPRRADRRADRRRREPHRAANPGRPALPRGGRREIGSRSGAGQAPRLGGRPARNAYDCSGLLMRAYEAAGMTIPRCRGDQYHPAAPAGPRGPAGDFLLLRPRPWTRRDDYHVTMYIGDDKMVEAPNKDHPVRVQPVPWDLWGPVPLATRPGTTNVAVGHREWLAVLEPS